MTTTFQRFHRVALIVALALASLAPASARADGPRRTVLLSDADVPPVAAQAEPNAGDADEALLGEIEEMLVTARKREENLQQTPVSITAIGAKQLESMNATRLDDIGRFVPNLQLDTGSGTAQSARTYIRGIGEGDNLTSFDPASAIYVDGVYQSRAVGSLVNILDIERVEVLRGPQGTLFGRNTTGGAVLVVTKKPGPELEAFAEVGTGSYDRFDAKIGANIPVVEDRLYTRFAVLTQRANGYSSNVYQGNEWNDDSKYAFTGSLRAYPMDAVTVDLRGYWTRTRIKPRGAQCRWIQDPVDALTNELFGYNRSPGIAGADPNANAGARGYSVRPQPSRDYRGACQANEQLPWLSFRHDAHGRSDVKTYGVSLTADWELGQYVDGVPSFDDLSVKNIVAWNQQKITGTNDYDYTELGALETSSFEGRPGTQWQISEELQFTGKQFDDKLTWVAGFFGFWEATRGWAQTDLSEFLVLPFDYPGGPPEGVPGPPSFHFGPSSTFPSPPFPPWAIAPLPCVGVIPSTNLCETPALTRTKSQNKNWNQSYAGFAEATWDVYDWMALTAGLRYTYEKKQLDRFVLRLADPTAFKIGTVDTDVVLKDSWSNLSPKAVLSFEAPTDRLPGFIDQATFYGSYSRGFRSGGFNGRGSSEDDNLDTFKPEKVNAYEIGLKSTFFDRQLVFNSAWFYTDYQDIQFTVLDVANGDVSLTRRNVGAARMWGLEFEITGNPRFDIGDTTIDGLLLTAAIGYIDTKILDFMDTQSCRPGTANCLDESGAPLAAWDKTGERSLGTAGFMDSYNNGENYGFAANANPTVGQRRIDRSNESFFNTPDLTVTLMAQYRLEMPDFGWRSIGTLTPRFEWMYQGDTRYSVSRAAWLSGRNDQPAFSLINIRLFWDLPDDRTRVVGFVTNVANEEYFTDAVDFAASLGSSGVYFGPPRLWGVQLSYRY